MQKSVFMMRHTRTTSRILLDRSNLQVVEFFFQLGSILGLGLLRFGR